MPVRVDVEPDLLAWALDRSGRSVDELLKPFPLLERWLAADAVPTLKQLERFAAATRTPFGLLLLPAPPEIPLPLPDFRTTPGDRRRAPSPDLLDTIQLCEERQEWYRRYAVLSNEARPDFVGSVGPTDGVEAVARSMRDRLGFGVDERAPLGTATEVLSRFAAVAEDQGVLVMISGVVGSNTRRRLDPSEFRGFALVDEIAPTVFVNGADAKAAQLFTLAHELAHVWLGRSGVSNTALARERDSDPIEAFCNAVAGELLVPAADLRRQLASDASLDPELARLVRRYRVSSVVILRRLYDLGRLDWQSYHAAYEREASRWRERPAATGGDFYHTQPVRTSKRLAHAVVADTLEGRTLFSDAYRLLGVRRHETFRELGHKLGFA